MALLTRRGLRRSPATRWPLKNRRVQPMKSFYLFAAVIGAIVPGIFFFQFIQINGLDLPAFVSALFVNGAAGGFSSDLLISSFVFWGYMFQQTKTNSAPRPWLFVALNLARIIHEV
jgi:hypothetical protein